MSLVSILCDCLHNKFTNEKHLNKLKEKSCVRKCLLLSCTSFWQSSLWNVVTLDAVRNITIIIMLNWAR